MSGTAVYVARRLATSVVTLLGVAVAVFLLVRLLPGDPARVIAGLLATDQQVAQIRHQLGLDQPLATQFATFLLQLLQGNLGVSARTSQPVLAEILARLPYTLELAVAATLVGSVSGILMGVAAAVRRTSWLDFLVSVGALAGISMPVYWLGLLLIILFAVDLHWLPAAGADRPGAIVLPALTLALFSVALVARMTRAAMLETLRQDYVRTATAKGVGRGRVIFVHALRNAFLPILTVIALQFGNLLGGAVLTETVFGWPGMGQLLVNSIFARDYPMIQGIILVYATLVVLINLLVDLLYTAVDPRIRYS
ncbi:MAG: ABC transporter permease [Clostridia bacterium]|nr:ABC transporter permease [Clostridia bacterium]MCL6522802.1 ABC transporter permease [Bacillota bacterium]